MNRFVWTGTLVCFFALTLPLKAQTYYTGDRQLWLMNGAGTMSSSVYMGYADPSWHIAAIGRFNGTTSGPACDIVWENLETGDRLIWLMSGSTFSSAVFLPNTPTNWRIVGAADFDGDGKSDLIWEDMDQGYRVVWYMSGTTYSSSATFATVSTNWHIAGVGSFQSGGRNDLVWQNTTPDGSGNDAVVVWLMSGTTLSSSVSLGSVASAWRIAAAADFNGDLKSDILLENTSTGDRCYWLMNGTTYSSTVSLGSITTNWRMAGAADFNADAKADILWEDLPAGDSDANGVNDSWELANFSQTGTNPIKASGTGGSPDGMTNLIKAQLQLRHPTVNATPDSTIGLKVTQPR